MKIKSVEFIKSVVDTNAIPTGGYPEIAFSGRSNVGKSSLINCLLNRRAIARVSSTPGKTQQLNFYLVNESVYFVDLPGYGYAKAPKQLKSRWKRLVESYFDRSQNLRGIVQLIDSRHDPTSEDLEMINWLAVREVPTILILTKIDKLRPNQRAKNFKLIGGTLDWAAEDQILPFSVKTGEGRDRLLDLIAQTVAF